MFAGCITRLTPREAKYKMQPSVLTCADLSTSYSRDPRDLAQANLIQVDAGCDVPRVLDSRDANEVIVRLDTTSRGRLRAIDSRGFWARRLDKQLTRFQARGVSLFVLDLKRVRVGNNVTNSIDALADALVELMVMRATRDCDELFILLEKTSDHGALSTARGLVSFISLVNSKLGLERPDLIDVNQLVLLPMFTMSDAHMFDRALENGALDGSPYACIQLDSLKPRRGDKSRVPARDIAASACGLGLQAILLYDVANHRSVTNRGFSGFMRWSTQFSHDVTGSQKALG